MREIFPDRQRIHSYLEMAHMQAKCGVIPLHTVEITNSASLLKRLDLQRLCTATDLVGYSILPLRQKVAATCGDVGCYVHWGVTTRSLLDSALVLQLRAALDVLESDIQELRGTIAALAARCRHTPIARCIHAQQPLFVKLGYMVVNWSAMFDGHQARLIESRKWDLAVQSSGAAGVFSSISVE